MRIGNSGLDGISNGGVGSVGGTGSGDRTSASSSGTKSDSVSLSNAANLIALAKSGAASRQSKIQSISEQVKSGNYSTDSDQVSRSLVEGHITG
jgi:anti-sigma28 factor (negative regulator of flagellin synthesis)